MSYILRDPFFNGIEDVLNGNWPFVSHRDRYRLQDNETHDDNDSKRVRRDVITPFSGFGRMDLQETDKSYDLNLDIPGMNKSDISITAENNVLSIQGERKHERTLDDKDKKYHFTERHFGRFHREISLPANANADQIQAVYDNGVLHVVIPKVESGTNKKLIDIK